MSVCENSNCECNSCLPESNPTIEIEHKIKVTHVKEKVVHLMAPRKSSNKVVSTAGDCLNDPEGCSIDNVKSMAGSILSVSQGHDDPVYKAGRTYVEEYIIDDYEEHEDDWQSYTVVKCDCGNLAAKDCDYGMCGGCCDGCSRHN